MRTGQRRLRDPRWRRQRSEHAASKDKYVPVTIADRTLRDCRRGDLDDTDIYLAALGILLTCGYLAGLIFRPKPRVLGIGVDSLAVLVLYGVGMAGLFAIALIGVGQG